MNVTEQKVFTVYSEPRNWQIYRSITIKYTDIYVADIVSHLGLTSKAQLHKAQVCFNPPTQGV